MQLSLREEWNRLEDYKGEYGQAMFCMRRLGQAGHCVRHMELAANLLILWEQKQVQAARGRSKVSFNYVLQRETGYKKSV